MNEFMVFHFADQSMFEIFLKCLFWRCGSDCGKMPHLSEEDRLQTIKEHFLLPLFHIAYYRVIRKIQLTNIHAMYIGVKISDTHWLYL